MNPAITKMTVTYSVDAATSAVPQGYKQTDVGVIPEDWLCADIGALNPFVTSGSRGWAEFYSEYGQPFVRITNTKRHSIYLDLSDLKFVKLPETSSEGKRTSLVNGDVLISITADIGISSYVDESLVKPAYINQHIALVRFNPDEINSKFVAYFLSSENVQKLFRSTSDQGAKAGLNLDSVRKIQIALPSKSEQTTIANALSDVDALIQEMEKLIAKKQAIKTATMQQLLTGRTRLPQFAHHPDGRQKGYKPSELGEIPEDWEVVCLGDLATIKTGSRNNQDKEANGAYPFFVRSETVERLNTFSYDCEAILVPGEGGIGSIFHYIHGKFDAHQRVYVIRNFQNCSGKFVYLQMRQNFGAHAMENSVKATVDSLRLPTFQNFTLLLPSVEEQDEVARILWDMDEEVKALGLRLAKTRQIKQGMMQELLTGKTRLV
ncbi:TPA: restriction endonuclease subunit S [Vibrio cholerae]